MNGLSNNIAVSSGRGEEAMTKRTPHGEMIIITINLPETYIDYIRELNDWGNTPSRSEYIRKAVANQIEEDLKTKRYMESVIKAKHGDNNLITLPNEDGNITTYRILREA